MEWEGFEWEVVEVGVHMGVGANGVSLFVRSVL